MLLQVYQKMLNMSGSHFACAFLFLTISMTVANSKDSPNDIPKSDEDKKCTIVKVDTFVTDSIWKSLLKWGAESQQLDDILFALKTDKNVFEIYRDVYNIYCNQPVEKHTASEVKCGSDYSQVEPQQVAFHDTENSVFYDSNYKPLKCVDRDNCYFMSSDACVPPDDN